MHAAPLLLAAADLPAPRRRRLHGLRGLVANLTAVKVIVPAGAA